MTADTVIELVPLSSAETGIAPQSANGGSDGNVLVITNEDGSKVTKDTLLLVTDDGIGFADMNEVMARANKGYTHRNDKVMVHAVAYYDSYSDGYLYYRPLKVNFDYKKYKECDASYIGVCYECTGSVYSYPSLTYLNPTVTHSIVLEKYHPAENKVYSKEKPYPANLAILPAAGSAGSAGSSLTFNLVVDGKTIDDWAPLI